MRRGGAGVLGRLVVACSLVGAAASGAPALCSLTASSLPTGYVDELLTWTPGPHQSALFQHTLTATCHGRIDFASDGTARLSDQFAWDEQTVQSDGSGDTTTITTHAQGSYSGTFSGSLDVEFKAGTFAGKHYNYYLAYQGPPTPMDVTGERTTTSVTAGGATQTTRSTIDVPGSSCWAINGAAAPSARGFTPGGDTGGTLVLSGSVTETVDPTPEVHVSEQTTWNVKRPAVGCGSSLSSEAAAASPVAGCSRNCATEQKAVASAKRIVELDARNLRSDLKKLADFEQALETDWTQASTTSDDLFALVDRLNQGGAFIRLIARYDELASDVRFDERDLAQDSQELANAYKALDQCLHKGTRVIASRTEAFSCSDRQLKLAVARALAFKPMKLAPPVRELFADARANNRARARRDMAGILAELTAQVKQIGALVSALRPCGVR